MNIVCYLLPLFITGTFSVPVKYDQRQDGEINVRADLQNFVIVALIPKLDTASAGTALLNAISKSLPERKSDNLPISRRSDEFDDDLPNARSEPFQEKKNTPYHVDITKEKSSEGNKAQVKVTQPGKKSPDLAIVKKSSGLSVESPVPDIVPVKNNRYVSNGRKNGRRSLDYDNDIVDSVTSDNDSGIEISLEENDDDPPKPSGVQYWLLGSRANCGPDAYRDASLLCVPCPKGQVVEFETGLCKDL